MLVLRYAIFAVDSNTSSTEDKFTKHLLSKGTLFVRLSILLSYRSHLRFHYTEHVALHCSVFALL